ncbi:hypothetical protein Q5O89_04795 [Peribacillus frigoritolerans]|nr:hypothetical protein [Peribacillus frigoritolerans]
MGFKKEFENGKREVLASVKDERLVEKRRTQMIKGAVTLFKEKGISSNDYQGNCQSGRL